MSNTYEHKFQMIPLIAVPRPMQYSFVRFDLHDEWYTAIDLYFLAR